MSADMFQSNYKLGIFLIIENVIEISNEITHIGKNKLNSHLDTKLDHDKQMIQWNMEFVMVIYV